MAARVIAARAVMRSMCRFMQAMARRAGRKGPAMHGAAPQCHPRQIARIATGRPLPGVFGVMHADTPCQSLVRQARTGRSAHTLRHIAPLQPAPALQPAPRPVPVSAMPGSITALRAALVDLSPVFMAAAVFLSAAAMAVCSPERPCCVFAIAIAAMAVVICVDAVAAIEKPRSPPSSWTGKHNP